MNRENFFGSENLLILSVSVIFRFNIVLRHRYKRNVLNVTVIQRAHGLQGYSSDKA